jgi:hypothetical protein
VSSEKKRGRPRLALVDEAKNTIDVHNSALFETGRDEMTRRHELNLAYADHAGRAVRG